VRRAAREAHDENRVLIGAGLAQAVRAHLSERVKIVPSGNGTKTADVAFASVDEVTESDGIARKPRALAKSLGGSTNGRSLLAKRTIVLVSHAREQWASVEKLARFAAEVIKNREQLRVITDLAVFDLTGNGVVIREVAPGVSARSVQEATGAALLAGPDLAEMTF